LKPLLFVTWNQDTTYHLAVQRSLGSIVSACNMVMFSFRDAKFLEREPTDKPCCSTCSNRSRKFFKAYFDGVSQPFRKTKAAKVTGSDEYYGDNDNDLWKDAARRRMQATDITITWKKTIFVKPDGWGFGVTDQEEKVTYRDVSAFRPGCRYHLIGEWNTHNGKPQFRAAEASPIEPTDFEGTSLYIASICEGIGPVLADRIVEFYGPNTALDTLKKDPKRAAKDVRGLREPVALGASDTLIANSHYAEEKIALMTLLHGRGFYHTIYAKCLQRWGGMAAQHIRENPFILMETRMPGAGFGRCDSLWIDMGLPPDAVSRQMWCMYYMVTQHSHGDVWVRSTRVEQKCQEHVAAEPRIEEAIVLAEREGLLVQKTIQDERYLSLRQWADHETRLAQCIKKLSRHAEWNIPDGLSDHQREAMGSLRGTLCVLTGGPGTGKTYVAGLIVAEASERGLVAMACAPTGKAADRIHEMLGIPAATIHSMLRPLKVDIESGRWDFEYGSDHHLPCDLIVVDEASMVDQATMCWLLEAIEPGTKILLVADVDQLPPVGVGQPLVDLIKSGVVPVSRLTEIHRFAGRIAKVCKQLANGATWSGSPPSEVDWQRKEDPENLLEIALNTDNQHEVTKMLQAIFTKMRSRGFNPLEDIQVIVARNTNGPMSRRFLNEWMQNFLNAKEEEESQRWRPNDKIIVMKNENYTTGYVDSETNAPVSDGHVVKLRNGTLGFITEVSKDAILASFHGQNFYIPMSAWLDFDLGYAITGHKSQGSQWPVVITIADEGAYTVCSRNWWYTAISRASTMQFILGRRSKINEQCRRVDGNRKTQLVAKLK
jgi:exodeoxyribonuclease V alpha subunit